MADDITQQLLQMQSMINAAQSNGKPAFLFGWIPLEINVGGSMSMQSMSPFAKNIPALFKGSGKEGGIADKFLKAMASIPDDLKERAAKAGIMYDGPMPGGNINSGSFTASIGSTPSSGFEIG